ncbi:MAG: hypothetical protein ACK5XV_04090 [Flavobacteriales bacterium]
MKHRITILNITSAIFIIWSNYTYWTSGYNGDAEGWGMLAILVITGAGLLGILIDFGLQKYVKHYWKINGIELVIIAGIWIFNEWAEREKTLIIPDSFKGYVTIVYGVDDAESLYTSVFNLGYTVMVPQSGVLFTSTPKDKDIWDTRFQTKSGELLDYLADSTKIHAIDYENGAYTCNSKTWEYRTWLVSNVTGWNKEVDIDSLTISTIENYCNLRK